MTEGRFVGVAFSSLADLHLEPRTCVEGPHEGINSVVYPPIFVSLVGKNKVKYHVRQAFPIRGCPDIAYAQSFAASTMLTGGALT
jgi:hypothetical protein